MRRLRLCWRRCIVGGAPLSVTFGKARPMTFRDAKLQQHCEKTAAVVTGCPPEQLPVLGLLDAWYWFHLTEGDDSARVAEAIEHLLSAELRPALRQWYQRWGDDMNENALRFRDRLSELAGERFG
jgi:hypothetical protein